MDSVSLPILFVWIFVQSALTFDQKCGEKSCEIFEFKCGTGECLNLRHFCDGIKDCPDGSDEMPKQDGCKNSLHDTELKCKLPKQYECDGFHHCDDKSDEEFCNKTYQMRCNKFGFCINKLFLNCSHRPEWNCSHKILCAESVCTKFKGIKDHTDISHECGSTPIFSCNSGECLDPGKFCDGIQDCVDGSDEIIADETNIGDGLACSNKWNHVEAKCVLPSRHMCDKIDHCDDRADECQNRCQFSFFCGNGKCLPMALPYICNGHNDCGDSSDECPNCTNTFKCNDGTCIAMDQFCDGRTDCPDESDELSPASVNESQVICSSKYSPSKKKCVLPNRHKCDHVPHCKELEDELDCDQANWFECDNRNILDKMTTACNFKDDCCDSSDECNLPEGCNKTFTCLNTGKCIAFEWFCDGDDDCGDGSDEIIALPTELGCVNKHNNKNRTCVLPDQYICDSLEHCEGRVDECTDGCQSSFFCNNDECIPHIGFCNGKNDCSDNSDELTSVPGFKCHVTNPPNDVSRACVLPQRSLFDDISDCRDQSDNCKRDGACFRCSTRNFSISSRQVCDGIVDCPDMSDECMCMTQNETVKKLCDNYCLLNDLEACKRCNKSGVVCDGVDTCISVSNICDGTEQCSDRADEKVCKQKEVSTWAAEEKCKFKCQVGFSTSYGKQCDGIPQCKFAEDECTKGEDGKFICGNETLEICKASLNNRGFVVPHCPRKLDHFLSSIDICDGKEDCERPANEDMSPDEKGCKDRWKCPNSLPKESGKSTIHISRLCDSEIDCEGEEDEAEELCRVKGQSRFYCENRINGNSDTMLGPLFVSMQQVLNGKNDCWDESDECPTKLFENNTFSSRHRMIRNMILSKLVWIMGILAIVGNFVVMWHTVLKLRERRSFSTMKSNYILVFNLAVADFLMGIYLLALAIQNERTDGSYCKFDREWRSSSMCSALGSLAMISIQSSVCFLVILTSYRMWVVLKPFKAEILKVRYTVTLVVFVWFFSLVLAIAPRLESFGDYFVSSALITPGVYFFNTNTPTKWDLGKFSKQLISYENATAIVPSRELTWVEINNVIETLYPKCWPEMKILEKFGYFSAHSVCLPKLFTKVHDSAWAFSASVMIFDFLSFLYVVIAYILIYNDASKQGAARQNRKAADENKTMQARITRLVLADFMCLVPVCITAFISVLGVEIDPVAYAIAAIVLLPINSALNPILYSNVVGVLYRRILQLVRASCTCVGRENDDKAMSRKKSSVSARTTLLQLQTIQDVANEL